MGTDYDMWEYITYSVGTDYIICWNRLPNLLEQINRLHNLEQINRLHNLLERITKCAGTDYSVVIACKSVGTDYNMWEHIT